MMSLASVLFVASVVVVVNGQSKLQGAECAAAPGQRQECGYDGITAYQCAERGCCWQECPGCGAGVPWCYHSSHAYRAECLVADEDKEDCGSYGVSTYECVRRGCCWAPSNRDNIPWCFQQKVETTTRTTTQRPITPSGPSEGDTRLSDGYGPNEGRFEMYIMGEWATICARNITDNLPDVLCRHFGFPAGMQDYFPGGTGPILTDTVICPDDATDLYSCVPGDFMMNDCTHDEDLGVTCAMPDPGSGSYDEYDYYYN